MFVWKDIKLMAKWFLLSPAILLTFIDEVGYYATIHGQSMKPCLNPDYRSNDKVLLTRVWNFNNIKRGDVVSLIDPRNSSNPPLIKRVICLPGDTVRTLSHKEKYVKIPQGHLWVEGDNNDVSIDSNKFGPVALGLLQYKAAYIIWPIHRWRKIESFLPVSRGPLSEKELQEINNEHQLNNNNNTNLDDTPVGTDEEQFNGLFAGTSGPFS